MRFLWWFVCLPVPPFTRSGFNEKTTDTETSLLGSEERTHRCSPCHLFCPAVEVCSHSQHFLSVGDLAHSVLAATTDACFVLSVEGVVELVNNAAEHMFMNKAHKIMGQHIAELLSGPGLSSFLLFPFVVFSRRG